MDNYNATLILHNEHFPTVALPSDRQCRPRLFFGGPVCHGQENLGFKPSTSVVVVVLNTLPAKVDIRISVMLKSSVGIFAGPAIDG